MRFFHNEVSSEAIQGYVRQGTQIEQVWQQVDEKVTELILQGIAPWDAYSKMGYALAFVRACRLNVVLVQKLLEGADPKNAGYIPRETFDQAQALGEIFEPFMEEAIKALDPHYVPGYRLPLQLRRIQSEGRPSPPHLLGMMAASRETREWAAGLLAQYTVAIEGAKLSIPQPITAHLEAMKNQLALGDFHLESGMNLIGAIRDGKQVADSLCIQGENLLWEAMESFYQVSQLIAYPGARTQPSPVIPESGSQIQHPTGRAPITPPPSKLAHVSDLLNQLGTAHPGGTPAATSPGAPDLLSDLQMKTPAATPHQSSSNASTLFDQLQLNTPPASPPAPSKPGASDVLHQGAIPPGIPGGSSSASSKSPPDPSQGHSPKQDNSHPPATKKVADLLSELGGEQKDQD